MFDYPKTLAEAKKYRYTRWAGNPKGTSYQYGLCAYEVFSKWLSHQCTKKAKAGPGNLYCTKHAKRIPIAS